MLDKSVEEIANDDKHLRYLVRMVSLFQVTFCFLVTQRQVGKIILNDLEYIVPHVGKHTTKMYTSSKNFNWEVINLLIRSFCSQQQWCVPKYAWYRNSLITKYLTVSSLYLFVVAKFQKITLVLQEWWVYLLEKNISYKVALLMIFDVMVERDWHIDQSWLKLEWFPR